MILIAGIPSEPPVAMAVEAAEEAGLAFRLLDQRKQETIDLDLRLEPGTGWSGQLLLDDGPVELAALTGIYARLMDPDFLPGIERGSEKARRAAALQALLLAWLDIAPVRVANRPRAMLSNTSKTYQAWVIRQCGFGIPETLVTNDPARLLAFVDRCAADGDEVIYKSVSGVRSIVQTFAQEDRARVDRIRWCPTQFQRKVRGTDYRVHVVGGAVFPVRIESDATDYRYAARQTGEDAELSVAGLPDAVRRACVRLSEELELPFAGIDLRRAPDGSFVCFEVNPSPAYSYYESRTGAPIADALVRWLSGYDESHRTL